MIETSSENTLNTPLAFNGVWEQLLDDTTFLSVFLSEVLEEYIQKQRWYGGKASKLKYIELSEYFKIQQKRKEGIKGNILLFTDSEENNQVGEIDIPDDINVAVVGIGTIKGGPIPVRDRFGVSRGSKKHNRKVVISSLNEQFLKNLSTKIKNYRYWIAQSYNLPTEEILGFFRSYFSKSLAKGNITIRPVKAKLLLVPFVVLFITSVILSRGRTFIFSILFFSLLSPVEDASAQEENIVKEKKEVVLSPETLNKFEKF